MDASIRLLITEEKSDFNEEGIKAFENAGFTPIFCQRDGEEVLRKISAECPRIVIMDVFYG